LAAAAGWVGSVAVVKRSSDNVVIRRRITPLDQRSLWLPVLRGCLVAEGDGCRFDGVVGAERWQRLFWVLWSGPVVLAALGSGGYAVVEVVRGDGRTAVAMGGLCSTTASMMVAMLGMVLYGYHRSRRQVDALEAWIRGSLAAPWLRVSR